MSSIKQLLEKSTSYLIRLEAIKLENGEFRLNRELFDEGAIRNINVEWYVNCNDPKEHKFTATASFELIVFPSDDMDKEILNLKGTFNLEFSVDKAIQDSLILEYQKSPLIVETVWPYFMSYASNIIFNMGLPRLSLPASAPISEIKRLGVEEADIKE